MSRYHIISRIAIYMLSVVLISLGVYHFYNPRDLIVYIPASLPGDVIWVKIVGAAFIVVGVAFLFNKLVKLTGYLLFVLMAAFIILFHVPNYKNAGDKEMKRVALINILKDTAIAAFALFIAAGAHHQHLHIEEGD